MFSSLRELGESNLVVQGGIAPLALFMLSVEIGALIARVCKACSMLVHLLSSIYCHEMNSSFLTGSVSPSWYSICTRGGFHTHNKTVLTNKSGVAVSSLPIAMWFSYSELGWGHGLVLLWSQGALSWRGEI